MARTVRDAKLDSRTSRAKLAPSGQPYYRALDQGLHLGYRKGKSGGKWVMRWRGTDADVYKVETIGTADDTANPDGVAVLSYAQAQEAVRGKRVVYERTAKGMPAEDAGPYTVKNAIDDYLAHQESEGKKAVKDARYRADALIVPKLGDIRLTNLTAKQIDDWKKEVAKTGARRRQKAKDAEDGKTKLAAFDADDEEVVRRRRSSCNRVLTILKAALNHAWREGKVTSDEAWRRVRSYREADAARVRYLTMDEAKRLLNACEPDFRSLVHGALVTGCRYGELAALEAHDFIPDASTVHVRKSKSGKGRHVVLNAEGLALFDRLTAGRPGTAHIFAKSDGTVWGKSHQFRPFKDACDRAKIVPPLNFHALRHSWASLSIMAGAPLMVVAQNLGHADTRMVEKHYGHLAKSYVTETISRTAPSFEVKPGPKPAKGAKVLRFAVTRRLPAVPVGTA